MSTASAQDSVWPTGTTSGKLSRDHAAAYLERINLPTSLLDSPPSLDLLRQLQPAHMLAVPFESLSVHVPDWSDLDAEIFLGGGETVHLGAGAYRRIVELRRGGYCFSLNSTFAAFLRYFGFRVSECAARVNGKQRQDPEEVGYEWQATSHQVSIVDWQGSDERFLVDIGFGRSCAYPIPLRDGASMTSIPSAELFQIRQTPRLPGAPSDLLPDSHPFWTVWTRCTSPTGAAYFSPLYSFLLQSVPYTDFISFNHYQSTHPAATFRTFFVATLLHANGERSTLQYRDGLVDDDGKKAAKFTRTAAPVEGKREDVLEKRWVEMRVGKVRAVLESEFGMTFPSEYSGN
ncbi:hypothetical protein JCM8097_002460 [Rhodosporidiobolus ruineniae]